ncbi:unnamed protein product [Staurois parvus]|uniref:Ig-like domain-containing protein n=1 Tax=Staurois parvus TaxID=386267 RepID=A0ABN9ATV6_9NEOB|nr:unnamed protein product [Staurois parvus]
MNDKDLNKAMPVFFISNIQITDEGNYRCFVIFTPDSGSTTSTLQVSVKPQTALSHDQHIEVGIRGSVRCEVSNFYPETVKIRWDKSSKSNSRNSSWDKDVCFTTPLGNSDGTFNVTSVLTVEPTTDAEPGDVLFCIVSHRSLEEEMTLSFIMPRRNPGIGFSIASAVAFIISYLTYFLRIYFNERLDPRIKVVLGVIFMVSSINSIGLVWFIIILPEEF